MAVHDGKLLAELTQLVADAKGALAQVEARLDILSGSEEATDMPLLSAKELTRVNKVGPVASAHLSHIEENGSLTLGESLQIRREHYGENVRASASLFGRKGENSVLRRIDPEAPKSYDEDIELTHEGKRIARLWRQLHANT